MAIEKAMEIEKEYLALKFSDSVIPRDIIRFQFKHKILLQGFKTLNEFSGLTKGDKVQVEYKGGIKNKLTMLSRTGNKYLFALRKGKKVTRLVIDAGKRTISNLDISTTPPKIVEGDLSNVVDKIKILNKEF